MWHLLEKDATRQERLRDAVIVEPLRRSFSLRSSHGGELMRAYRAIALLMLAVPTFIFAQKSKKHSDVSAVFMNARYVYVEAESGDITRPGLYPEDRKASRGQGQGDDGFGVGAEAGPSDDMLRVFTTNPDGKLIGPVWYRELKDGLDGPTVLLLQQLRAAVEKAYPSQTPNQPTPKKP